MITNTVMTYARTAAAKASFTVAKKSGHASIPKAVAIYVNAAAIGAGLGRSKARHDRRTRRVHHRVRFHPALPGCAHANQSVALWEDFVLDKPT
jgi:hypothetical protein